MIPPTYKQLRKKGYRASEALRLAKSELAIYRAEINETFRFRFEPDESFDDSWVSQDCFDNKYRQDIRDQIDRDGVWGVIAEVRCLACKAWKEVDSLWGLIGTDIPLEYRADLFKASCNA